MADLASIGVAFVVGAVLTGAVVAYIFRRYNKASSTDGQHLKAQIADLNSQITSQAETFRRTISSKDQEIDKAAAEARAEKMRAVEEEHERTKLQVEKRLQDVLDGFKVVVSPYVFHTVEKGLIRDMHRIEKGYMYRLTINGVGCLSPHYEPHGIAEKVESDPKMIEAATKVAIESARAAAAAVAAFGNGKLLSFNEIPDIKTIEKG